MRAYMPLPSCGMSEQWSAYVLAVAGSTTPQKEIATRSGVDQATISRWRDPGYDRTPTPAKVAMFCRAYKKNPLQGFVAAGLIDAGEAKLTKAERDYLDRLDVGGDPAPRSSAEKVERARRKALAAMDEGEPDAPKRGKRGA